MILVVSIGGSVLTSNLDPERIRKYASSIQALAEEHTTYIVVGGGRIARDYITAARDLGANEVECDIIGIDMTRINAKLLIVALGNSAYTVPLTSYQDARNAALTGRVVVMGGLIPGQTTDAVSAVLAEYVGADMLINATSVDGVYTVDPNLDSKAEKISSMTPSQLVDIVMKTDMSAGSNSPLDPLAAKIIQRCGIKTFVIDGREPGNINEAAAGRHNGTLISVSPGR
ncbi:MAG: UMP kinase [ANME-2 cluster archaeon]|nr:UMP kinase [ANME-2 cluster archaeon]MBC2700224.1 UMP kinase [ANME-2 cluster archaeon]MBC2707161.1 UMP kinase [ANME-2 cluster archaeon]MBC2747609.1 UMP kinase [ANME-2 cluster archaeon]MBC2764227.1 UMP kinase [ANME-2 cluster archaeon]